MANEIQEGGAVLLQLFGADAVDAGQFGFGFGGGGGEGVEGLLRENAVGGDFPRGGLFGAPGAEGFEEDGIGGGDRGIDGGGRRLVLPAGFWGGLDFEGRGGAGGKKGLDVEAVGAGLDARELDAGFGLGLFLGVQELAAQGLVVEFAVGGGEGIEDDVA